MRNAIYTASEFKLGSVGTYQCLHGYSAHDRTTEWVFECGDDGKWNITFVDIHCDGKNLQI